MSFSSALKSIWNWTYAPATPPPPDVPVLVLHVPVTPEVAEEFRERPEEIEVIIAPKPKKAAAKKPQRRRP